MDEKKKIIQLVGAALLGHDIADFPDISRLHHWQLGLGMILLPELLEDDGDE
jgi:hypothetical protein